MILRYRNIKFYLKYMLTNIMILTNIYRIFKKQNCYNSIKLIFLL